MLCMPQRPLKLSLRLLPPQNHREASKHVRKQNLLAASHSSHCLRRGGGSGYDPYVTEKKFEEMRRRKEEERRGKDKDDRDYDRRRGDDDDRRKDDRDRRRRDDRDDDYDDRRRDKADDRRRRDDPDDDYDDRRYRDDRRSRNDRDDRDDRDRRRRNDDDDIDRRRRDDRDRRRPDDDDDRRKPSGRDRRRHEDDDEDDFRPDRAGSRSGKQAESASANLLDFDGPPQPAAKAGTASDCRYCNRVCLMRRRQKLFTFLRTSAHVLGICPTRSERCRW